MPTTGHHRRPATSTARSTTATPGGRLHVARHDHPQLPLQPDYHIDLILWREILGGVTDAIYVKPTASYRIADGFHVFARSSTRAPSTPRSTPSGAGAAGNPNLGVEINVGARYETEDGFFGQLEYGILFPLRRPREQQPDGSVVHQACP